MAEVLHTTSAADRTRRRAQRLEDAGTVLLAVLLVLAAVGCWAVVTSVHGATTDRARAEARQRTATDAVLVYDIAASGSRVSGQPYPATVRWTGHDGRPHTGTTRTELPGDAGDRVRVWTTADDRLVPAPVTAADAVAAAVVAGVLVAITAGATVLGLGAGLYRWTGRRFAQAWEEDWARVEPVWTGRARQ